MRKTIIVKVPFLLSESECRKSANDQLRKIAEENNWVLKRLHKMNVGRVADDDPIFEFDCEIETEEERQIKAMKDQLQSQGTFHPTYSGPTTEEQWGQVFNNFTPKTASEIDSAKMVADLKIMQAKSEAAIMQAKQEVEKLKMMTIKPVEVTPKFSPWNNNDVAKLAKLFEMPPPEAPPPPAPAPATPAEKPKVEIPFGMGQKRKINR